MEFTALSTTLHRALDAVTGIVPANPNPEILGCVHLERKGDYLELRTTDTEVAIRHRVPVQFVSADDPHISVAVPARQFLDTCRFLPETPVTVRVSENYQILLSHERGNYDWSGFPPGSFSEFPEVGEGTSVRLRGDQLKGGLDHTAFVASKDISRPGMVGLLLEVLDGSTRLVATDGVRLSRHVFTDAVHGTGVKALARPKAFMNAVRQADDHPVDITVSENNISFEVGDSMVVSQLINARYPNYEKAIPTDSDKVAHIAKRDLAESVRRISLFAPTETTPIQMEFIENAVHVRAADSQRSTNGAETVDCLYAGEQVKMVFSAQYLYEMLRNLPCEEIKISFSSADRAVTLEPHPQGEGTHLTFLIMPIQAP